MTAASAQGNHTLSDQQDQRAADMLQPVSRYSEIAVLVALLLAGGPINLLIFLKLWVTRPRHCNKLVIYFILQHLNLTDMLVMFVYIPTQIAWTLSNSCVPNLICKAFKFFNVLIFYASSNVIVCIAIDRILNFYSCWRLYRKQRNRLSMIIAWCLASVCSLPQLAVFETVVFEHGCLCVDVWWPLREYELQLNSSASFESNSSAALLALSLCFEQFSWQCSMALQNAYFTSHSLVVFWIPALVLAVCHSWLIFLVYAFSSRSAANLKQRMPRTREVRHTIGARTRSRIFRITTTLTLTYIVCWIPYNILTFFTDIQDIQLVSFFSHLIVLNSVINPYIYGLSGIVDYCRTTTDIVVWI